MPAAMIMLMPGSPSSTAHFFFSSRRRHTRSLCDWSSDVCSSRSFFLSFKAKALNDKKNEPVLIDPQAGVKLVVPSMENVGQLRQSAPPEGGKSYWMVFSNKGRLVKRGDHVNVVIGAFHADGLVVD